MGKRHRAAMKGERRAVAEIQVSVSGSPLAGADRSADPPFRAEAWGEGYIRIYNQAGSHILTPAAPGRNPARDVLRRLRRAGDRRSRRRLLALRAAHQFDYDQTWAAFFLNADGSIYGRYGTRAGGKEHATTHISLASLKKAMQRALELHRGYPANKAQLTGKLGQQPEYQYAEQIPASIAKAKQRHCIHCHNVTEDLRQTKYEQRRLAASDIWVYPLPENVGLKMDVDDGLRVQAVTPESPAARAGVLAGDELVTMNGQRLISQADIQWVLHNAPAKGQVTVTLNRGGQLLRETLALSGRWKETDLSWRESSWALRPGLWTIPLSEAEKREKGIPGEALGLFVKWVPPRATLAKQAGLRDGDVIVAVDGQTAAMNESQFIAYVRLHHPPGDTVALTLLRGDRGKT